MLTQEVAKKCVLGGQTVTCWALLRLFGGDPKVTFQVTLNFWELGGSRKQPGSQHVLKHNPTQPHPQGRSASFPQWVVCMLVMASAKSGIAWCTIVYRESGFVCPCEWIYLTIQIQESFQFGQKGVYKWKQTQTNTNKHTHKQTNKRKCRNMDIKLFERDPKLR